MTTEPRPGDDAPESGEITVSQTGDVVIGVPLIVAAATPPPESETED